ncbi:MAG: hypothetical protein ACREIM_02645 [Nitrospiraceae bacterium]
MQAEPHTFLSRHGYLFLALPGFLVLSLAIVLFESSANMDVHEFKQILASLMQPDQSGSSELVLSDSNTTRKISRSRMVLTEIKARYIWLSTVVLNLIIPLYVGFTCGLIIYRAHPRRRLFVVCGVGLMLCLTGITLLATQNEHHVLYRAVYGFAYLTLTQSGIIDGHLLQSARWIVSLINILAAVVPVFAVLAVCSILAPPPKPQQVDPHFLATQMRQLNEVLYGGSAILVSGILHMGAWLRWPASLVPDKGSQEAVLGAALSITIFWGTTFTLMLIVTYLPAAIHLAKRAHDLLASDAYAKRFPDPDAWLKEHGLRLSLEEHILQFGVLLAPVLAGPLGSFLLAPLNPVDK